MTQELIKDIGNKLDIVVASAREHYIDCLEEYFKRKNIEIDSLEKLEMEKLFSDAVYTYIVPEAAAFLTYLISIELDLDSDEIFKKIVPTFLDECEGKIDRIPEKMLTKENERTLLAKNILEAGTMRAKPLQESLLKDFILMPDMKHMRASYAAVLLYLMGE